MVSKKSKKKAPAVRKSTVIAGAVGIALAGATGGYIYRATTEPQDVIIGSEQVADLPSPQYGITRYRLYITRKKLDALTVREQEDAPAYNQNGYVPMTWTGLDEDNCQTRYNILFEKLSGATQNRSICTVSSGKLFDYYSGKVVAYDDSVSGGGIDIDHIVSKKNAWDSGGYNWDKEKWEEFANDKDVLIAVSSSENRSKGSKDAADWLVPNNPDFQCLYVVSQVNIKDAYDLTIRQAEKDAMRDILYGGKCKIKSST